MALPYTKETRATPAMVYHFQSTYTVSPKDSSNPQTLKANSTALCYLLELSGKFYY